MKKTKKILALALAAVMLVCTTVAATVAYLQDTDSVSNTFTIGQVDITLDELPVDPYGVPSTSEVVDGETVWTPIPTEELEDFEDRVKSNTYKLIPGHRYVKDPTVTVGALSEDAWLFVKIENDIAPILNNFALASGWTQVGTSDVYYYNTSVEKNQEIVVFSEFTVNVDADVADYNGETIVVTAYAIQKDGFDITDEADRTLMLDALGLN